MVDENALRDRILAVLRPFASSFSGSLCRGDLVIPNGDVARVVSEILEAMRASGMGDGEASELSVFDAVCEARRRASVQDQAKFLRDRFLILERR